MYPWTEGLDSQWTEELDRCGGFVHGICSVFSLVSPSPASVVSLGLSVLPPEYHTRV